MIFLTCMSYLCLFTLVTSFKFKYNRKVPFICEVHDINVKKMDSETIHDLQYIFRATPVLIFKNQILTPEEQLQFTNIFDFNAIEKPLNSDYSPLSDYPQLEILGNGYLNTTFELNDYQVSSPKKYLYNKIWSQDKVGIKNTLPSLVNSMYILRNTINSSYTSFASLEKGHDNIMSSRNKLQYLNLNTCYSYKRSIDAQFDDTGYGRLDKYWTPNIESIKNLPNDDFVIQPFVIYPDKKCMKKSLMISPDKLFAFVGYTPKKSHEIMCDIMNKYILIDDNVCDVYHEENDLILFNNRKVIRSTVPIGEIDGEFIYSYLSLDTNEKYTSCLYT